MVERLREKVNYFSAKTGKFYQLVPTRTVPVLKINAVPMHRFAKIDPLRDAELKVKCLRPRGEVLDVCTGLGYSAIQEAMQEGVTSVVTVEKDPEVIEMARINPSSSELFSNPKIRIVEGDAFCIINDFSDESFGAVLHDPPTFVVAPELYHADFYRQLYRVLARGGRLWHYAPEPGKAGKKGKNVRFVEGIIKRLKAAGFDGLNHDPASSGITGTKR